jgi:SAM-dependent methyltransferase
MVPELDVSQAQTLGAAKAVLDGGAVPFGAAPYAAGTSERSLEVPFAAHYTKGAKAILDIGFTFSSHDYMGLLLELQDRGVEVRGYDIVTPARVAERYPQAWRQRVLNVPFTQGDIRTIALPQAYFDVCACISTLEHIGFDEASDDPNSAFKRGKTRADAPAHRSPDTDAKVMSQFARALKPGGIAIVTVPVGRGGPVLLQDSKGLFTRQWEFDEPSLARLKRADDFVCIDEGYFRETPAGWVEVDSPRALEDVTSAERRHAAGCGLLAFRRN